MHATRASLRASLVAFAFALSLLAGAVATPVSAAAASPARAGTVAPAATTAWFVSPSHNIGCLMDATSVRCDVLKHTWKPTKKPASCHADWGTAVRVGRTGRARFLGVSDTVAGSSKVLAYGHSKTIGRFTCASRTNGIRCVNNRNGHGFRVAKGSYSLY